MALPGQVKATRGPGRDTDYALFALLISRDGARSLFMADRLPTSEDLNKAFFYVWHILGKQQGYLLADVIDPVFVVKSTGARLLDRLFDAIEPWLDGGEEEPMVAMANDLLPVEAYGITLQVDDDNADLKWQTLTPDGFKPAFQRIGQKGSSNPGKLFKLPPRRGEAKGFQ